MNVFVLSSCAGTAGKNNLPWESIVALVLCSVPNITAFVWLIGYWRDECYLLQFPTVISNIKQSQTSRWYKWKSVSKKGSVLIPAGDFGLLYWSEFSLPACLFLTCQMNNQTNKVLIMFPYHTSSKINSVFFFRLGEKTWEEWSQP